MMTTTYDELTVTYDQSTLTYQGLPAQFDGVAFAVEMAFGYNPLDDDLSWESVTPYVRGFSTDRGRTSEFVDYSPGTASILLDNRDRRFDPEYVSGPYFGQLNPMVPVRIQATYSGVTYTMYTGFVQGWPTAYNQSNTDAVATVNCVDANRLLANIPLPAFTMLNNMVASNPYRYWTLQETFNVDGQATTPDYENRGNLVTGVGTKTQGTEILEYPSGASTYVFGGGLSWKFVPTDSPSIVAAGYWFDSKVRDAGDNFGDMYYGESGSVAIQVRLRWISSASTWRITGLQYNSTKEGLYGEDFVTTTDVVTVDGPNYFAWTLSGNNLVVYMNGVAVRTLALSTSPVAIVTPSTGFQVNNSTGGRPHALSHISMYTSRLSASTIGDIYSGGLGYGGELSSARLTRALDDAGWPAAFRQIETGVQPVGAYVPAGSPTVRYLEQVESAEQGALFVNAAGEVEFQSRTTADTPVIAALFDDNGTDLPFAGVSVDAHTVDAIRNNVVVNYVNGSTTSTDAGSVAAYGTATQTVDAQLVDDPAVAQSIGDNLLARAKDPRTRITSLQVNMRRDPANLVPAVASLDLADDVVVSLTPTGVGDALWRAVTVQGLSHTVTPQSWDVTMYLAPGPVATNGPLLVLDDDTYGELDNNKLG